LSAVHHFDDEGTMTEGDSPTVARRRVRLALREAREASGRTQADVAEEMEWSLSKVIRIENGDVSIAPNDLRPLLTFLGVRDKTQIAELIDAAKVARTRHQAWYQSSGFREHLTDPIRKLIEYEAEATYIHSYGVFYIPGSLQIPEYAKALIATWHEELTADQIKHRLDARKRRHEAIVARVGSLHYTALLDESVLMRLAGGPEVLSAQLQELIKLNEAGMLKIRLLPFSAMTALSYNADFDLLFLHDDGDLTNAVMYRETGTSDEILEDLPAKPGTAAMPPVGPVARHHDRYLKLWNAADNESDTITFIKKRIRELG
jgi:transcriptional regulator with XRE-family HTH domain